MPDVFTELAHRLRGVARSEARTVSEPVSRWQVVALSPLRLRSFDGESELEEGEDDFEPGALADASVGDVVVVAVDGDGDYVGLGVLAAAAGGSALAALKARVTVAEGDVDAVEARSTALEGRASALEALASVTAVPTASGQVDVAVPAGTNLVTLDYEYEVPATSEVWLQPNGDASNVSSMYQLQSTTLSPDSAGSITPGLAVKTGILASANLGASGAVRAAGRATITTRNYSGRTPFAIDVAYINTTGAANTYVARFLAHGAYDLAAAITFLRFKTSAGNFNGGVVRARFS